MKKQLKRVITSNNQIEVNKKKIYKKKKKLFATKNDKYWNKVGESFSLFFRGGGGHGMTEVYLILDGHPDLSVFYEVHTVGLIPLWFNRRQVKHILVILNHQQRRKLYVWLSIKTKHVSVLWCMFKLQYTSVFIYIKLNILCVLNLKTKVQFKSCYVMVMFWLIWL